MAADESPYAPPASDGHDQYRPSLLAAIALVLLTLVGALSAFSGTCVGLVVIGYAIAGERSLYSREYAIVLYGSCLIAAFFAARWVRRKIWKMMSDRAIRDDTNCSPNRNRNRKERIE